MKLAREETRGITLIEERKTMLQAMTLETSTRM